MDSAKSRKALEKKGDRKADGKMASGSIKGQCNLRKRDRVKLGAGEAKAESSMGRMEVDKAKVLVPSLVEPKTLVKEDLENKFPVIFEGDWDFLCTDNEDEGGETTIASEPKRSEYWKEWEERWDARQKAWLEKYGTEDYEAFFARQFRRDWEFLWSHCHGSFEDTTRIPPMRYTEKPDPEARARTLDTLQIFSAKVAEIKGDLQWPLDVFGMVAIRDSIDQNRNIIFNRTRDNCQILTEKDQNLVLIGPSRAVVLFLPDPVTIEVDLKLKGSTESEDEDLSFLAVSFMCDDSFHSCLHSCAYTSKLSTLEFLLGFIVCSVEATVSVHVISGSWPDGFHGKFSVFTTGIFGRSITCDKDSDSIDYKEIVLFDSRSGKMLITDDGNVELSRRVVSVEISGKLKLSVKAWRPDNSVVKKENVFTPMRRGYSDWRLHIGSCEMKVTVAWSLISSDPVLASSVL